MTNQITPDELSRAEAGTSPPLIIDVWGAEEFAAGHIPGAEKLPMDELERWIGQIPKDKPIVVYCNMRHPGRSRSERVAEQRRAQGYNAEVLTGGFPSWEAAGYPVASADHAWRGDRDNSC